MAKPVPLGTLFELPLESFGVDEAHDSHITAAALQELDLDDVGEATTNGGAALPTAAPKPTGPTCIACGIGVEGAPGFASAEEQRRHFSLDWHRYNIKRRAAGRERVSKGDFEALLEDERQEVGSISGSESEHSGDEDDEDAAHGLSATTAGPQFAFIAAGASPCSAALVVRPCRTREAVHPVPSAPLSHRADSKRYAVWRPLLAPDRERSSGAPPPASRCLAALRRLREQGARWAVVMLRGGHFAAAVFGVDPARVSNTRQPDKFEVLAHKSAHRYVVRWGGDWCRAAVGGGAGGWYEGIGPAWFAACWPCFIRGPLSSAGGCISAALLSAAPTEPSTPTSLTEQGGPGRQAVGQGRQRQVRSLRRLPPAAVQRSGPAARRGRGAGRLAGAAGRLRPCLRARPLLKLAAAVWRRRAAAGRR